ncbi:hypothetical protein cypCar_00017210 [Cyprinus carpio]|nr:hypothetical protein cypCar_00017210 [Cyprinus carpio]
MDCDFHFHTLHLYPLPTVKKAIELKSRGVKMLPSKDTSHKNAVYSWEEENRRALEVEPSTSAESWSMADGHFNFGRVGASIQFSCDDSYVLQGSKSITCQRVTETLAAWSDHRPICRSKCKYGSLFPCSDTFCRDVVRSC